jgi:hypothetical protein
MDPEAYGQLAPALLRQAGIESAQGLDDPHKIPCHPPSVRRSVTGRHWGAHLPDGELERHRALLSCLDAPEHLCHYSTPETPLRQQRGKAGG